MRLPTGMNELKPPCTGVPSAMRCPPVSECVLEVARRATRAVTNKWAIIVCDAAPIR